MIVLDPPPGGQLAVMTWVTEIVPVAPGFRGSGMETLLPVRVIGPVVEGPLRIMPDGGPTPVNGIDPVLVTVQEYGPELVTPVFAINRGPVISQEPGDGTDVVCA